MPVWDDNPWPSVTPRRRARIRAMQILCQWEVQPEQPREHVAEWLAGEESATRVRRLAQRLTEAAWNERPRWDAIIAQASANWDLSRISAVERNIMRVALAEWLTGLTPQKIAIDEAIEIAKMFGGADSPRFINGVLDAVYRRHGHASG